MISELKNRADNTCMLCLNPNAELRMSHIIPEFNYEPCYDEKHRFVQLSSGEPIHKIYQQKGLREKLLCQTCETTISRWEKYASQLFCENMTLTHANQDGFAFGGADYKRLRLYGLSLIWRMSVSELEFFSGVQLGPHEEVIRKALVAEDPLDWSQYPFFLAAITINGRFRQDWIVPPSLTIIDGAHVYRALIAGIAYTFHIASHLPDPAMQDMAITKSGTFKLPVLPIQKIPYLFDQVMRIQKAIQSNG